MDSLTYYTTAFGTPTFNAVKQDSLGSGGALGVVDSNIVMGANGVTMTESLNTIPLELTTLNSAGTRVVVQQTAGVTKSTHLIPATDLPDTVTTTNADNSIEETESFGYDGANVENSYSNSLGTEAVMQEDVLHRPQTILRSAPGGGVVETEQLTYQENSLTDRRGPPIQDTCEDMSSNIVDGWKVQEACDETEYSPVSYVVNNEGTLEYASEGVPSCTDTR